MRYCPRCGYPKELHPRLKGVPTSVVPKEPSPPSRLCIIDEVDDTTEDSVPAFRANAEQYARHQVKFDGLRAKRIAKQNLL